MKSCTDSFFTSICNGLIPYYVPERKMDLSNGVTETAGANI